MPSNDPDTNPNSLDTSLPDETPDTQTPPEPSKPDEHVPPVEVPGRQDTPQPIPEKGVTHRHVYPILVKNGRKTA